MRWEIRKFESLSKLFDQISNIFFWLFQVHLCVFIVIQYRATKRHFSGNTLAIRQWSYTKKIAISPGFKPDCILSKIITLFWCRWTPETWFVGSYFRYELQVLWEVIQAFRLCSLRLLEFVGWQVVSLYFYSQS